MYLIKVKKKKIRTGDTDSLYWRYALTVTVSYAPILKGNTTIEFKTLILKDSEGLSIIFSRCKGNLVQPPFSALRVWMWFTLFEHQNLLISADQFKNLMCIYFFPGTLDVQKVASSQEVSVRTIITFIPYRPKWSLHYLFGSSYFCSNI